MWHYPFSLAKSSLSFHCQAPAAFPVGIMTFSSQTLLVFWAKVGEHIFDRPIYFIVTECHFKQDWKCLARVFKIQSCRQMAFSMKRYPFLLAPCQLRSSFLGPRSLLSNVFLDDDVSSAQYRLCYAQWREHIYYSLCALLHSRASSALESLRWKKVHFWNSPTGVVHNSVKCRFFFSVFQCSGAWSWCCSYNFPTYSILSSFGTAKRWSHKMAF